MKVLFSAFEPTDNSPEQIELRAEVAELKKQLVAVREKYRKQLREVGPRRIIDQSEERAIVNKLNAAFNTVHRSPSSGISQKTGSAVRGKTAVPTTTSRIACSA